MNGRGDESPEYRAIAAWFFVAVTHYVDQRMPPDEPLFSALVCGDVKGLVWSADEKSQATLWLMMKYLYNHTPSNCWGSESAMARWLANKEHTETA